MTKGHVIAIDPERDALDAIADGGGTGEAIVVADGEGLKAALLDIVESAD